MATPALASVLELSREEHQALPLNHSQRRPHPLRYIMAQNPPNLPAMLTLHQRPFKRPLEDTSYLSALEHIHTIDLLTRDEERYVWPDIDQLVHLTQFSIVQETS